MRPNPLCGLFWGTLACLPQAPLLDEAGGAEVSESVADSAWPEIDPPESLDSEGEGEEAGAEPTLADMGAPEPVVDAHLRIVGISFDPPGTDGAADAPEWLELVSLGPEPYPLARLRVEARSWPVVEASDFEQKVESMALEAGVRLRIERYASGAKLPPSLDDEASPRLAFSSSSGLRNADGAARVFAADGSADDELCYGDVPPPEPYGRAGMWTGPCHQASAGAACRLDETADQDHAGDWGPCE